MKKKIFLTLLWGLVGGLILAGNIYAQQAAPAPAAGEAKPAAEAAAPAEGEEAYGEVVSIDANAATITITEYDYEKDEDVNKTYTIDKAATYENVKSLAEVKAGDWVALTLQPQKDGASIVSSVYVERYDIAEETAAPAGAPAAPEAAPAAPAPAETK